MARMIPAPPGTSRLPIWIWGRVAPDGAVAQLERIAAQPYVVGHVAAMPDLHVAQGVAVGTVFATSGVVVPSALGGDPWLDGHRVVHRGGTRRAHVVPVGVSWRWSGDDEAGGPRADLDRSARARDEARRSRRAPRTRARRGGTGRVSRHRGGPGGRGRSRPPAAAPRAARRVEGLAQPHTHAHAGSAS